MTALLLSTVVAVAAPVPKEVDDKFEKDVAKARAKAIDFLKKKQTKDGNWEGSTLGLLTDMDGGVTALVTLGLLESGVPPTDDAVTKAVEYLVKLPPKKTYVVSLQTQVLARVDAKKYKEQIQKNADWLVETALKKDGKLEGWSYPGNEIADGSNTHFAVIGLHAAAQAGAKVEEKPWREVRELYLRTQTDKGWSYYNSQFGSKPTHSMTTAGLVGLVTAGKYDKDAKKPDEAIKKGLKLLQPHELKSEKSTGYLLMVTAELGRALGGKEFKTGDKNWAWYRQGAEMIVKAQKEDGSLDLGRGIDANATLATAFGLYFLGPPAKK